MPPVQEPTSSSNPRQLRLTIAVTPRTERVVRATVAPGVPARHLAAGHPFAVVSDVGGEVAHVSRHPSPFVQRSTRPGPDGDHHYGTLAEGLIEVAVPFTSVSDLTRLRVRLSEISDSAPRSAAEIAQHLDDRAARDQTVREIGFEQVRAAPNWSRTADALGIPAAVGQFEVSIDRDGRHRWRLRRADGSIAAASTRSFGSRDACEADIIWVKEHAGTATVR